MSNIMSFIVISNRVLSKKVGKPLVAKKYVQIIYETKMVNDCPNDK